MHDHSHVPHTAGNVHKRSLLIAFVLTLCYMIVEFTVGIATGSLALISDAAHMGTDTLGLGMALIAITLASRPPTAQRTFGFYRLEVLAALANGVLLFGVGGFVVIEAIHRFIEPAEIPGLPLIIVAVVGLIVNLVSMYLLSAGQDESLNVRGAYLEVLSDALGSVGVIVSAAIILLTGWAYADSIMGLLIGVFILPRTWKLTRRALAVLLEAAPADIDVAALESNILAVDGVDAVHDLHVWTITSGMNAAAGHVTLSETADQVAVLGNIRTALHELHNIDHVTMQCEPAGFSEAERGLCDPH